MEAWQSVKTDFRVAPIVNDDLAAKGVSAGMVNDAFERKANQLLRQRSKENSPDEGSNTDYNSELSSTQEGKFQYKDANLFAFIVGLKDLSGKLIELAKVPAPMWNPANADFQKSVVNVPAVLAGGMDQTLEELTDGLQFVNLALDIAAEPAKAKQIWDGIRSIRPSLVANIIKEHAAIYAQPSPSVKPYYQAGRDGVTIATMWKGLVSLVGKAATGVTEAGVTVAALLAGGSDELVAMLLRLQKKFKALNRGGLFDQFKKDFESKPDLVQQFDTEILDIRAYDALATSSYRTRATYLQFFGNQTVRDNLKRVKSDERIDFKNLTFEHVTAIYHYTTPAFRELNAAIRNPAIMTDYLRSFQTVLNEAVNKLPKRIGTTFRGTSLPEEVIKQYEDAFKSGTLNIEKAFTSTSVDLRVAQQFADRAVKEGETRVIFRINGRTGVDINRMSAADKFQEAEVLFKSNSQFKVTDFRTDTDTVGKLYIIELTE
ncbi:ADP-ribosyltransferase domain-containing protein [Fibrisoma limi]|nr:ADP-ribosyltransferase domain-containing protein [Fibrisoma limi]